MRFIWAGGRMGDLKKLGEFPEEKDQFAAIFEEFVLSNYHSGWVVSAPTEKGVVPVGMIFGVLAGPMMLVGDFTWFTWASKRNVMEGTATFFRGIRDQVVTILYVAQKDRAFFDYMKQLGLIRPIGTIHDVLNEPAMLYQTRRTEWAY